MEIAQVFFCISICINIRHLCQTSLFSFPQLDRQQKRRLDTFLDDGHFVGYMLLKFRPFLSDSFDSHFMNTSIHAIRNTTFVVFMVIWGGIFCVFRICSNML